MTGVIESKIKCKICHEPADGTEQLHSPCRSKGSMKYIHNACLFEWIQNDSKPKCEICNYPYKFKKIFKPNTPNRLPLSIVLKDLMISAQTTACYILAITIFLLKVSLVFGINYFANPLSVTNTKIISASSLIFLSNWHYQLYNLIKKY
eukprot:GHVR01131544.1.p3 GENE.GHVR01131544.1~~GHVR01131544.1.p3  ORF type:complete len:149 (-),score=0.78 GHVR01131544.1:1750-2196(-)